MSARLLLVDDHELMRDGLRLLLGSVPHEFEVIGDAADGPTALAVATRERPDVVVLDLGLPGVDGIEVALRLRELCPSAAIVALSGHGEPERVRAMLDAGARGYVVKHAAFDELLGALRAVRAGRTYLSPGLAVQRPADGERPLSAREREVARLVAVGLTSRQIATELGCAVKTVESHRKQIMDKLGLDSIAALTRWALRVGLIPAE